MPHSTMENPFEDPPPPHQLVLCFDGTGNAFLGNPGDTNIVKLLDMFDRRASNQLHYYQPGIGTYSVDGSVNPGFFGGIKRSISQQIDVALATSFDAHVIAGYRFLMRYYTTGDQIYIFGFSRGAFTARFVARMVSHVGLLSMGNEEMAPFAYKVYQDYEFAPDNKKLRTAREYMNTFSRTFCRSDCKKAEFEADPDRDQECECVNCRSDGADECTTLSGCPCNECQQYPEGKKYTQQECTRGKSKPCKCSACVITGGIKPYFLGLFDTVNSVGTFDTPFGETPRAPEIIGNAKFVRHAVAADERRVRFKPALLAQEYEGEFKQDDYVKEVWFPGTHCDVGGGWMPEIEGAPKKTWSWSSITRFFSKARHDEDPKANKKHDRFQLSDIPLKWMVDELDTLATRKEPGEKAYLKWNPTTKRDFNGRFNLRQAVTGKNGQVIKGKDGKEEYTFKHRDEAITGRLHDSLKFGGGGSFGMVLMWKLMEYLPLIRRWEYVEAGDGKNKWVYQWYPFNCGGTRDIPQGAVFHRSMLERLKRFASRKEVEVASDDPSSKVCLVQQAYRPANSVWPDGMVADAVKAKTKDYVALNIIDHADQAPDKGPAFVAREKPEPEKGAEGSEDQNKRNWTYKVLNK